MWNVYSATLDGRHMTNNHAEAWNRRLGSIVGHSRPTVWRAIDALRSEEATVTMKMAQSRVEYHHTGGEVPVDYSNTTTHLSQLLVEACEQAGFPYVDFNGATQTGTISIPAGGEFLQFLHSDYAADTAIPDIEVTVLSATPASDLLKASMVDMGLQPEAFDNYIGPTNGQPGFRVAAILNRPKSRGSITLRSTNPNEYPDIDEGFFNYPGDIKAAAQEKPPPTLEDPSPTTEEAPRSLEWKEALRTLDWNVDTEVTLFRAMKGHKPIGVNRYFQMACIVEKFSEAMKKEISSQEIWDHFDDMYDMEALEKRKTKIDVKFLVKVLPAVWAQLKSDVIRNCFRKAGFCRANDAPSAAPQDPSVPSVWPQIQEAFGAEDFADFVSFDDAIVDSEQLTDGEIAALVNISSDPLSEDDSSEEAEAPVKLSSSQAMDYIEALKGYFLQQQADCSTEVLQLTEMQHKVTAASLSGAKQALITQYFMK
ncbi:hypothetical protein MTO96_029690 [Rhipicephalus appendiculatus]